MNFCSYRKKLDSIRESINQLLHFSTQNAPQCPTMPDSFWLRGRTFSLSCWEVRELGDTTVWSAPCQTCLVTGRSKEDHATTPLCKQTNFIMQGGAGFASPRNVFPSFNSVSIHVSGYTNCCTFCRHLLQSSHRSAFWHLLKYFLHSMHRLIIFLVVQMNEWRISFFGW